MNITYWVIGGLVTMLVVICITLWIMARFWDCDRFEILNRISEIWKLQPGKELLKILVWMFLWPAEFPLALIALFVGFIQPFL